MIERKKIATSSEVANTDTGYGIICPDGILRASIEEYYESLRD